MSDRVSTQLTEMSEQAGEQVAEMSESIQVMLTPRSSDISASSHATLLSEKFTLVTVCNSLRLPQLTEMSELPGGRDVRIQQRMKTCTDHLH